VCLVVAEQSLGLDPVDDGLTDGDRNLQLDVRSFVVAASTELQTMDRSHLLFAIFVA
jgi:hypothetical protein